MGQCMGGAWLGKRVHGGGDDVVLIWWEISNFACVVDRKVESG